MNATLHFDPDSHQLTGPAGSLLITPSDHLAHHFLMLVEGQCLQGNVSAVAKKYRYCRQRYYQLLDTFNQRGLSALQPQKTGPKSNYRRTDQAVRQVLRHRFLDPDASTEVIAQKLRQTHFPISLRSVHRVIADYGLQKKTLRSQPKEATPSTARAKHPQATTLGPRRRPQRRTRGPSAPGR
jgi:transposase